MRGWVFYFSYFCQKGRILGGETGWGGSEVGAAGLTSAPTARPKAPAEGPQALAEGLFSTLNSSAFPEIQQFNAREAGSVFSSHVPAFTAAQVINNNQPLLLAGSPIPLLSLFFLIFAKGTV